MREHPEPMSEKVVRQLAEFRRQLAEVNARLKTTRSSAKREKLLARKRALKSRIDSLDPDREPPRYQTWGRWSKAPGSVRFWRGS